MSEAELIAPAQVRLDNGVPYAVDFADIYHSPDGPEEVRRVFIDPAGLAELGTTTDALWVGELGFGSALNFAVLAEQCKQRRQRLHFVSCDAAPLHPASFGPIAEERARELPIYHELIQAYPPLIQGWHRRHLADGLVTLSLYWGTAHAALIDLSQQQSRPFRAWFLDGFAPDRNAEMWSASLLSQLGQLSGPGTSVTTFTAAGHVRRSLQAAGFEMRKIDQRPHKRESLAGVFRGNANHQRTAPQQVTVVGAGIAGASVARQLANRGVSVTVFESGPAPAAGASGIPVSMLHPRLLGNGNIEAQLRCHAYLYSTAFVAGLLPETPAPGGALQLPGKNASAQRLRAIAARYQASGPWLKFLEPATAQQLSGWPTDSGGLWFPQSYVVDMPQLCGQLLNHSNIDVRCNTPLRSASDAGETPLILACAGACHDFSAASYLELAPVQGQVDMVELANMPSIPLIRSGYVVPCKDHAARDLVALGSTYEYTHWTHAQATAENLSQLSEQQRAHARWRSRSRGTRCVTSDRLPVVGPLFSPDQNAIPDVYVSTGMGSMGNVFSHYAGELLASKICGEFLPATQGLQAALSSLRFRQRQARRGYRLDARP